MTGSPERLFARIASPRNPRPADFDPKTYDPVTEKRSSVPRRHLKHQASSGAFKLANRKVTKCGTPASPLPEYDEAE